MKLLPTIVAFAAAAKKDESGSSDLPKTGVHDENCLFPNSDFDGVFSDKFSSFSFSTDPVENTLNDFGDYYAEGTTLFRQCPVPGSCKANLDESLVCDMNGELKTYPCEYNTVRKMYAFSDTGDDSAKKDNPRTLFFRSSKWQNFKKAGRDVMLCEGYGKRKMPVQATDEAAQGLCGDKPMVPASKEEWADQDNRGVPTTPRECTIWNDDMTSTTCATGCKKKAIPPKGPKTLNLVCTQKKYGTGKWAWWSYEGNKLRPAGKRLLKATYWCIPDKDYIWESSGEGSGEGSGAQEIENADVDM